MNWVKCSDRLPGKTDRVSFVMADGQMFGDVIWFDRGSQGWMENGPMDSYGRCKKNVTHWYPEPLPPEPIKDNPSLYSLPWLSAEFTKHIEELEKSEWYKPNDFNLPRAMKVMVDELMLVQTMILRNNQGNV